MWFQLRECQRSTHERWQARLATPFMQAGSQCDHKHTFFIRHIFWWETSWQQLSKRQGYPLRFVTNSVMHKQFNLIYLSELLYFIAKSYGRGNHRSTDCCVQSISMDYFTQQISIDVFKLLNNDCSF